MTTTSSADTEAREESAPLSEPCLARRAPAELMVYSTKRPPSIRMAAHTSVPPRSERSVEQEDDETLLRMRYLSPFAS